MASSAKRQLQYDDKSKKQFESYFEKPKAKRGRPKKSKKRKRGRPKNVVDLTSTPKQTMMDEEDVDNLVPKDKEELDARLEGTLRSCERSGPVKRVNWDVGEPAVYRLRCADSWMKSTDLFKEGESYHRFCQRCGINRNVLKRFLKGKYLLNNSNTRGRPSLLSSTVMRHLCEGLCMLFLFVFVMIS